MMLDRVTKVEFSILNPIYLLPYIGMIHSIIGFASLHSLFVLFSSSSTDLFPSLFVKLFTFSTSAEWDVWILRGSVLFIVASYLHFVVNIVNELCTHLKIRCFKIVPKTN